MEFCLHHGIGGKHNVLLPGSGVNLKKFEHIPFAGEHTTEFIFISRIMKQKGIDEYLYVAENLTREYGNKVKFHVLGRCEDAHYERVMKNAQDKGGIVEVEAPIHVSNVALVSKGNVSKIGYKMENGKKVRYAKKTGEAL